MGEQQGRWWLSKQGGIRKKKGKKKVEKKEKQGRRDIWGKFAGEDGEQGF